MEETITLFAALSRDPMLAVQAGKITYCNEALTRLLPFITVGAAASAVLPEALLSQEGERFTAALELGEQEFSASALRFGEDGLAVALTPIGGQLRGSFLSDGLLAELGTQLFNVGLAAQRVHEDLPEGPGFARAREYLAALRRSYYAMDRQLSNLETAIHLQEGTDLFFPAATDLVRLCADLVSTVSILTDGEYAPVRFETELECLSARVDAVRIERMLLNLLSNSLKHTPVDGSIRLSLSCLGENAVISVDDTGSGIPADVMQNIFTRYEQRLDPERPLPVSGGLGLTVARGIAEAHGGVLVIEGREGHGTSVRVMLPLDCRSAVLENRPAVPGHNGMPLILSELSDLLDRRFYDPDYS